MARAASPKEYNTHTWRRILLYLWAAALGCLSCACLLGIGTEDIGLRSPLVIKNIQEYWFFLLAGVLFCTPIVPALDRLTDRSAFLKKAKTVIVPAGYVLIFLWAVSYLLLGAHNPFIYFNF